MRIDVLLKNLCLTKTRGMARKGCDTGNVKLNGAVVKASKEVRESDLIEIRYPDRVLVLRITEIPSRPVPKKSRSDYFETVRETPLHRDSGGWNV
ncbi:MAG: RNA-binding protein [Candidatus Krumholzibacteria bacterium]|nr:RNA-binding protein [Candidatus Krumholzibacteria bacterium]